MSYKQLEVNLVFWNGRLIKNGSFLLSVTEKPARNAHKQQGAFLISEYILSYTLYFIITYIQLLYSTF
jgi:hypothetical protein